ncbi:MAG TPA: pilus assembly protein N-terminal domain-containing protein [Lacipirellulaceae bacterium]|nr:pilus assembly protein N-terminal domain-containing protein [Lacipirellulaceae bacterium]
MYDNHCRRRQGWLPISTCLISTLLLAGAITRARAQQLQSNSLICKVSGASEKLELTVNTSRILTLDKNIPRVQVNNPDLLAVTPLSATQVQISAKKPGVTQVNLWDSAGKVHTVDVLIYGDARELELALKTQFPHASIKVYRYSESLVLTGYVDRPDYVTPIMQLAQDYSPKVINNITVGGVQQVLLKVKVMEVNRTKLRELGVDWAILNGDSILAASNVSGLLSAASSTISGGGGFAKVGGLIGSGGQTFQFGVFKSNTAFLGFLDALQRCQAAKILAEPDIVAVSGRPAQFQDGGEIPIPVPQSLGTTTIEFKPFGTIVDFLPIVLGNGNIRLEVRPQISAPDYAKAITINGTQVPAMNTRRVDTAVEMKAGQTFAIGGLIQQLTVTNKDGLPYISDLPIIGVPFRKTTDQVQETELLILVTPEFVDPIDACQAPCAGPGTFSTSPNNRGLYCAGHMEVPTACNPTQALDPCDDGCGNGSCSSCGTTPSMNVGVPMQGMAPGMQMPISGGTGYDDSSNATMAAPSTITDQNESGTTTEEPTLPAPSDISLPAGAGDERSEMAPGTAKPIELPKANAPAMTPPTPPQPVVPPQSAQPKPAIQPAAPTSQGAAPKESGYEPLLPDSFSSSASGSRGQLAEVTGGSRVNFTTQQATGEPPVATAAATPVYTSPRPYSPPHQPVFVRNASKPNNPQPLQWQPATSPRQNDLIGPIGYDVSQ